MIKLTYDEWELVRRQCSSCPLWDNKIGCQYSLTKGHGGIDDNPAEDCGLTIDEKTVAAKELELI